MTEATLGVYRPSLYHRVASRLSRAVYDWRVRRLNRLLVALTPDSNYVEHCRRELASWFAEGEDSPNRWMADGAERMLRLFAIEGHSGSSAPFAVSVFKELAAFRPWGPLTGEDSEWGEPFTHDGTQQNRRCSHVFRDNDGRAYDSNGKVFRLPDGGCYTNGESRVFITFPYRPKVEYVEVAE